MIKKFLKIKDELRVRRIVWYIWNDIKRRYMNQNRIGKLVIKEDGNTIYIKEHAVKENPIAYPAIYRPALEKLLERKGFLLYKRSGYTYF